MLQRGYGTVTAVRRLPVCGRGGASSVPLGRRPAGGAVRFRQGVPNDGRHALSLPPSSFGETCGSGRGGGFPYLAGDRPVRLRLSCVVLGRCDSARRLVGFRPRPGCAAGRVLRSASSGRGRGVRGCGRCRRSRSAALRTMDQRGRCRRPIARAATHRPTRRAVRPDRVRIVGFAAGVRAAGSGGRTRSEPRLPAAHSVRRRSTRRSQV